MLRQSPWFKFVAVALLLLNAPTAFGQINLGLSTIYLDYESSVLSRDAGVDPASRFERTIFPLDINAGYVATNKIYFGLTYHQGSIEEKSGSGALTTVEYERKAYGPAVGYISDSGLRLMLTYFIHAESKNRINLSNVRTNYEDGSGYQIDVAYGFKAGSNLFVGPNIVYRHFSYDTFVANGTSYDADVKEYETLPTVALWLML